MATLAEIRERYPQYRDMSDVDLAGKLHAKFYSDMPRAEFDQKVGLDPYAYEAEETRKALWGDRRPAKPGDEVSRDTVLPFREVLGEDGKPKTELAIPGLIMEPARAAARIFGGTDWSHLGGIEPLHQMSPEVAEQKIGDAMTASSVAMPSTRVPGVTMETQAALRNAAQNTEAFGPVVNRGQPVTRPSPAPQELPREIDPRAAAAADEALGPIVNRAERPESPILGGQPRDELLAAAERLGVQVPDAIASDSMFKRGMAGIFAADPFGGAPIVRSTQALRDAVEGKRADLINEMGGASRAGAGQTARDQMAGWVKDASRNEANEIYAPVDAITDKTTAVPLESLRSTLDQIESRARGMRLEPPRIVQVFHEAASDPKGLTYEQLQGLRTQVGKMLEGQTVGPEAAIDKGAIREIYGALSQDLTNLVRESGRAMVRERVQTPEGRRAVREGAGAQRLTKTVEQRAAEQTADYAETVKAAADERFQAEIAGKRKELRAIVGNEADVAPEAIIGRLRSYAGAKGGANVGRLQKAMSVLDEDGKREVRAAIISEIGQGKDGLSFARFRSELDGPNGMSPIGRQVLFGPELNQVLTDIATIGERYEQLAKLGNPSGTGRFVAFTGLASAVGSAVLTGSVAPLATAAGLVGWTYVVARMLSRPATARIVRDFADAYVKAAGGNARAVAVLERIARELEIAARAEIGQTAGDAMRSDAP